MLKNDIPEGNKLDSGNNVKKNQRTQKNTNLYFVNRFFAQKRIVIKNIRLIKTGSSKILLNTG